MPYPVGSWWIRLNPSEPQWWPADLARSSSHGSYCSAVNKPPGQHMPEDDSCQNSALGRELRGLEWKQILPPERM